MRVLTLALAFLALGLALSAVIRDAACPGEPPAPSPPPTVRV